jgi:uncharacterized repeat protein (TIGR01451 family)
MPHQTKGYNLLNVKVTPRLALLAWLTAGLLAVRVQGQVNDLSFDISVSSSANAVQVSNQLTYTIYVTNLSSVQTVFVTNSVPDSVQINNVTAALPAFSLFTSSTSAVFQINFNNFGIVVPMTVTATPTATGSITNTTAAIAPFLRTNLFTTNLITLVTNASSGSTNTADLAVSMTGPAQAVITNDLMTYGVTVSNLGPDSASNVVLTNTASTNTPLFGIWPTNLTFDANGTVALGTLPNQAVVNLKLTLSPTNAGPLTLGAAVGSTTIIDPDPTNNLAGTNIFVTNYLSGLLSVSLAPTQAFNPQNGLMEQPLVLSNIGTSAVASARVVLSGLTATNWLFNAAGTNWVPGAGGTNRFDPFVYYAGALDTNQSADLLLQYFVPAGLPFALATNQANVYEVPAVNLTAPSDLGTDTVTISRVLPLPAGGILVEFPSVLGAGYTVVYSDNASFTNPMVAMPAITAPADRVQWIDYGPPGTVSLPAGTNSRFYKVYRNP